MANQRSPSEKSCFVISPIGADKSPTRLRSDKVLKYIIKPIFEAKAYRVERADQLDEPGIITNQIVKKIVDCDILVADLSESNPNVFYELAIRHGLKRPFIHLIDASEKIPFDNSQVRTIQFDIADLDSVDVAKRQLEAQVNSIESGDSIAESPISVAFDLEALKAGGKEDTGILSVLLDEVMILGREVRRIRNSEQLTRRKIVIRDKADLVSFLISEGSNSFAEFVDTHVTYLTGGDGSISLGTNLPEEAEKKFMQDLGSILFRRTGKPWEIDDIPF